MNVTPETVIDFTYAQMRAWDRDKYKRNLKDPNVRPLMDEIIRRHSEGSATEVQANDAANEAVRAAAIKRQQEADDAQKANVAAAKADFERFLKLTPEEQLAEKQAQADAQKEAEHQDYLAKVERERELARLSTMTVEERKAEYDTKKAAAEQAEADRVAAEEAAKEAAKIEANKATADSAAAQKAAEDKAASDKAVADKEAADKAATEAAKSPKKKIVREYQAKDENGNPIGRRTHLEADTPEEMYEKLEKAHTEAVKYAERMKRRVAIEPALAPVEKHIPVLTDEQRKAAEKEASDKDAAKAEAAKAKINQDDINRDIKEKNRVAEYNRQQEESGKFVTAHPEFFPCDANADLLSRYILDNKLAWTASNLDVAYARLESKMAPRPEANTSTEVSPEVAAQVEAAQAAEAKAKEDADAKAAADVKVRADLEVRIRAEVAEEFKQKIEQEKAAQSAAASASAVTATPVVVPASAEPSAATPNASATERKLPTGGLEPGALHGARPVSTASKTPVLTKQDIAKMPRDEYRRKIKNPVFRKMVEDLFAPKA